MKKRLAITFMVDEKEVRRSIALLTGEAISDEDLESKYLSNPVEVDIKEMLGESDSFQMIAGFVGLIMAKRME